MISASLVARLMGRILVSACAVFCLLVSAGCEHLHQDMGDQPKANPLSPSDFFADGRSARSLVENTVARGALANDELFVNGDSNNIPIPVNQELLERGEERYKIFCTTCHGLQGDGNGMIAMRGMRRPPTYHQERLRQATNGHFYEVVSNGFGQMYSYAAQVPPRDRWAIIAYIRALQLSRNAKVNDLPAELREKLNRGAAPTTAPGADHKEDMGNTKNSTGDSR